MQGKCSEMSSMKIKQTMMIVLVEAHLADYMVAVTQ